MNTDRIDAVAQALHLSRQQRADLPGWNHLPDWWREAMRLDAKAAMHAMKAMDSMEHVAKLVTRPAPKREPNPRPKPAPKPNPAPRPLPPPPPRPVVPLAVASSVGERLDVMSTRERLIARNSAREQG